MLKQLIAVVIMGMPFVAYCTPVTSALFTPAERAWIEAHPAVTYTVSERWPQEFEEKGVHKGLSRAVLDDIARRTGLTFVYVSPTEAMLQRPMLISAVNRDLLTTEERGKWLMSSAWANTMPMIVGKNSTVRIRTLEQLKGQSLAIAAGSDYEPWLKHHYPDIRLQVEPDINAALDAVRVGNSAAAIGSGLVILPILQRHYLHKLAIIAQVPEMASGISMAVEPTSPELLSILDKTMETVTAKEAQQIFARWVGIVDIGTPGIALVLYYYRYEAAIFSIMLVLLFAALFTAIRASRRARRSEQHKSDFLAVMSHEIRTPMNAIVAALELMQKETLPTPQHAYNNLAHSSALNLLELLNTLLDNEKLEQVDFILSAEPLRLADLLKAICDSQRLAAEAKTLRLELTFSPEFSTRWIEADALRLRQILTNLISNAIKFTQQGGVSVHAVAEMSDDRICGLEIEIRDSGTGMTTDFQQRLFTAWSRGDHPASGSGLGLFLCRRLTSLMKGSMTLNSSTEQGTTVTIVLPVEECPAPLLPDASELAQISYQYSAAVLLVEDHPANLRLMTDQFQALGCHVSPVDSAECAMAQLRDENYYDIIFLDCGLPDMDGYTLARHIREFERQDEREETPLIAISALSGQIHEDKCFSSGMNAVLTKPVRMSHLTDLLAEWCPACQVSFSPVNPVAPVVTSDVNRALQDDLSAFIKAMADRDLRYMVHYLHRLKGAALMYELDALSLYAGSLEDALRNGLPETDWHQSEWISCLEALISSPAA